MTGQDNSTGPSLFYRNLHQTITFRRANLRGASCRLDLQLLVWNQELILARTVRNYSLFVIQQSVGKTDYTACLNPDLVFSKLNVQWNYPYIKHLTTSEFVLSVVVYSFSKNKPMSVFLDYYPWSKIHEMVKAFVRIPTGQRQFK